MSEIRPGDLRLLSCARYEAGGEARTHRAPLPLTAAQVKA